MTDACTMSLPEATPWVMRIEAGRLQFACVEVGAAALIELTLPDRIDSLPNRGFFDEQDRRPLFITDPTPLGVPEFDRALEMLAVSKPRRVRSWIWDIGRVVSDTVRARAVAAGLAKEVGRFPSMRGYLKKVTHCDVAKASTACTLSQHVSVTRDFRGAAMLSRGRGAAALRISSSRMMGVSISCTSPAMQPG